MGVMGLFTTLFALGALSVVACEWLTKYTKAEGSWAQVQSWAVSVVLGVLCSFLGFGIFNGVSTTGGVLYGVLIGLISNGIFDINLVKRILEMVRLRVGQMGNSDDKNKMIKS
jgi:hypothetical protein